MKNSMLEDEIKEEKELEELKYKLSSYLNSYSHKDRIRRLIQELQREHRTLQQVFTGLCVAWLEDLSKRYEEGNYDLRNEASCKLGKEFTAKIEERSLPFI